jgi:hypothetical protein
MSEASAYYKRSKQAKSWQRMRKQEASCDHHHRPRWSKFSIDSLTQSVMLPCDRHASSIWEITWNVHCRGQTSTKAFYIPDSSCKAVSTCFPNAEEPEDCTTNIVGALALTHEPGACLISVPVPRNPPKDVFGLDHFV